MDFRQRVNLQRSGVPRRFWARTIQPDERVAEWVKNCDQIMLDMASPAFGQGLMLCGPRASENAAWAFIEVLNAPGRIGDMSFLDWAAFLDDIRDRETRSGMLEEALSPILMVMDQVEMATRPEWATSVLSRVLKGRYDDGKPSILTTSKSLGVAQASLVDCLDFDPNVVRFVEILGEEG